jgi:hypothetical protein
LSTFLKNRSKLEEATGFSGNGSRKHLHEANNSDINEALYSWLLMACQSTIPINGPQMIEKGNKFAKDLRQNDFVAMASWIQQFKMHKGIESKVTRGEFTATDPAVEINWRRNLNLGACRKDTPLIVFTMWMIQAFSTDAYHANHTLTL